MRFYVITDLEGVAGVESFAETRESDMDDPEVEKAPAMDQLGRETNACVDGIRSVYPDAEIDVLDGHGTGGLRESDLEDANYLRQLDESPLSANDYDGMLFVGQHAMAGAPFAPLRHTQSSLHIEYYKLNGTFIGEFAGAAFLAGLEGVPTIFLAGDDKAAHEAEMFVPEIETSVVKWGEGVEAARHRDPDAACEVVRAGAARAVDRLDEIPPLDRFDPPYTVEIRFYDPETGRERVDGRTDRDRVDVTWLDEHTVRLESSAFGELYP